MRHRGIIWIAGFAAIAVWLFAGRYGSTPPFRDASGAAIPGSVAEMHRLSLGGVEQSITIRGRSAKAPILIWLHGGPGQDETGMWRRYNAELEDHFLVVYWTQRGTGRSYTSIPVASMHLSQFVADLDQLVGILKARFHKDKVVLAGHSWGTNIGLSYAQTHPQNVSALISIGQVVNVAEGERRSYVFTLAEARKRHDTEAISELERIGPPPLSSDDTLIERKWLEKFGGVSHRPMPLSSMILTSFRASEMTWYDGVKYASGAKFSLDSVWPTETGIDWLQGATRFQMPVFILAGRYDENTDSNLAREYFEKIEAPAKQFKWFEQSGHMVPFEEPKAFNAFIIDNVLPVVGHDRAQH